MSTFLYDSFWDDVSKGNIVMSTDTFYAMLVTWYVTSIEHVDKRDGST